MKIYNDWAELVTDPEWGTYISDNHIPLEFVERLWEEAQNSLLVTKNCNDEATDTFTDPRDEKVYKTVKIGNKIWMAENLAYDNVDHYFPNRDSANVPKYGCLYNWSNAMKACPPGWRLPTKEEFEQLLTITGADCDSSGIRNYTWENGSNSSGFNVLPAGFMVDCSSRFRYFGYRANFWSATPNGSDRAFGLYVYSDCAGIEYDYVSYAFPVRCIKDD